MIKNILRRLRGALGNALVWGAAWSVATLPVIGVMYLLGLDYLGLPLALAPRIAGTLFAMGFVAGGTFSTYLGLAYRNKRLEDLRPGLFALIGGAFAGLVFPMFTFATGLGMFLGASFYGAMAGGVAIGAVLGGVTAFGSVKIAQKALASGEKGPDELEPGQEGLLPNPEVEAL